MNLNKYINLLQESEYFKRFKNVEEFIYIDIVKNKSQGTPYFLMFWLKGAPCDRFAFKRSDEKIVEIFDTDVSQKKASFQCANVLENGNIDIRIRYYDSNRDPMGWDKQKIIDPKTGIVIKEDRAWPG